MSRSRSIAERLPARLRHVLGLDLPPYDPVATVAEEGPGTWFSACIYSWLTMLAALLSSAVFIGDVWFVAVIGLLLVASFPVTHHVHYTRISRVGMSWAVFFAAIITGLVLLGPRVYAFATVPPDDVSDAMRLLVEGFLWVMAWRAFSIRTLTEQVQTILPTTSVVLVSLVSAVHWSGLLGVALLVLGALALLALERKPIDLDRRAPVASAVFSRAARPTTALYSWPALYVIALLAAVGVGFWAARSELSTGVTDYVRMFLVGALARHFMADLWDHAPPAALWTPRLQPPGGRNIILEVACERPTNWRTAVYSTYNGKSWTRRPPRQQLLSRTGRFDIPLDETGISAASVEVEQVITPRVRFGAELPVAFCPTVVEIGDRGMRHGPDGTVAAATVSTVNHTYRVVSLIPPITPGDAGVAHPITAEMREANTALPADLSGRIAELAREIADPTDDPFDQARSIEQYLIANYTYDLRAPAPWPEELVEGFLFHTRRGYCYHFASAMVLMCRALDIPSRLAVGYTRGESHSDQEDVYIVRGEDAHAWPEVYIEDSGWLIFEPTPGIGDDDDRTFGDVWAETTATAGRSLVLAWAYIRAYWLPTLLSVVLLAGLVVGTRGYIGRVSNRPPMRLDDLERIVWAYRRMRTLLADQGVPDAPQTPAGEYLAGLPSELDDARPIVDEIVALYVVARFGPRPVTQAEVARTLAALAGLRETLARSAPRDRGHSADNHSEEHHGAPD